MCISILTPLHKVQVYHLSCFAHVVYIQGGKCDMLSDTIFVTTVYFVTFSVLFDWSLHHGVRDCRLWL